jgi:hypothetical protein
MADKNITVVKTKRPDEVAEFAFTSLATSDTVVVPCDFKDEHTMLLFLGGGSNATVTIKAGNGYAGVNDEVFEVASGKYSAITINSNRFKNVTGDYKGNLVIKVSAACSLAVVEARV